MNYIKIISSIIIAVPPSQLPDDVKKRLAEKAKSLPGYKTKMCNNFVESEGHCQYDEMCHYAHGEEELREESNSGIAYQPILNIFTELIIQILYLFSQIYAI